MGFRTVFPRCPRIANLHFSTASLSCPSIEFAIALVAPKSPQNVGAVARVMGNFGFCKLYISRFDGTDIPSVEINGTRASFQKFSSSPLSLCDQTKSSSTSSAHDRITLRFPTPDGQILSFPARDLSETLTTFFALFPQYKAQVVDTHGCLVDGRTPHAYAWVEKGRLLLESKEKSLSLTLRDLGLLKYGGYLRSHEFVAITQESYWMATSPESRQVLDSHVVFKDLKDLRSEFDYIIGSSGSPSQLDKTRKTRCFHHPGSGGDFITTPELLSEVARMAKAHEGFSKDHVKVLLVFGREMSGLHNDELMVCDRLMAIPTFALASSAFSTSVPAPSIASTQSFGTDVSSLMRNALGNAPSLNLSHAVAVVLYALNQQLCGVAKAPSQGLGTNSMMTPQERQVLHSAFTLLRKQTSRTKIEPRADDLILFSVRRALDRANLSQQEFKHFMGLVASANRLLAEVSGSNKS